jgi:hypothetical protein
MLQNIYVMSESQEKTRILDQARKTLFFVQGNTEDKTVDPSQTTRFVATMQNLGLAALSFSSQGGHYGSVLDQKKPRNF